MRNEPRTYHRSVGTNGTSPARSRWFVGFAVTIALGLTVAIVVPRPSEERAAARLEATGAPDASAAPATPHVAVAGTSRPDTGEVGVRGGHLTGPASPFDLDLPAIANLDADLLRAVQEAARDAAAQGVPFFVTSGWRTPAYQQQLLDEAIMRYASEDEARRWVATPQTSAHVTGDAVDIGPTDANSWLSQRGADYGLCQTYANEMWHFELATTPGGVCPRMRADATS